ncbi:MAG: hypothetical protein ACR2K5_11860 [Pseudolabrys sp.]
MTTSPVPNAATRALNPLAALVVVLCLSWGFNQVAVKAIHDIPPLTQAAVRSFGAAFIVAAIAKIRGLPVFARDGTLLPGPFAAFCLPANSS